MPLLHLLAASTTLAPSICFTQASPASNRSWFSDVAVTEGGRERGPGFVPGEEIETRFKQELALPRLNPGDYAAPGSFDVAFVLRNLLRNGSLQSALAGSEPAGRAVQASATRRGLAKNEVRI